MKIEDIILRRIIDSRGNPTVEAEIKTKNGVGIGAAPAGASTGTHEAMAWPENSVSLGMQRAEKKLMPKLIGISADDQKNFDSTLKEIDGMQNFSNIGGNVCVALSFACAKAAANSSNETLFHYLGQKKRIFNTCSNV